MYIRSTEEIVTDKGRGLLASFISCQAPVPFTLSSFSQASPRLALLEACSIAPVPVCFASSPVRACAALPGLSCFRG